MATTMPKQTKTVMFRDMNGLPRSPTGRKEVHIAKLQNGFNGMISKKQMTYRNPFRRSNRPNDMHFDKSVTPYVCTVYTLCPYRILSTLNHRVKRHMPWNRPLSDKASSNHSDGDLDVAEVDDIDFKSFLLEPNIEDLNSLKGVHISTTSKEMTFGSKYGVDFEGLKEGDLGTIPSIFDKLDVDMDSIKKVSPTPPPTSSYLTSIL